MTAAFVPEVRAAFAETIDDWLAPYLDVRGNLPTQMTDALLAELSARQLLIVRDNSDGPPRGVCATCHGSFVLNLTGWVRAHGKRGRRCRGSGRKPITPTRTEIR